MTQSAALPETSLRERLKLNRPIVAPGVYDALTAMLASSAGFEALYMSGAAVAYTRLGRPDIGLVSVSEAADTLALIADRTQTPLIVDADNGFGNALNTARTVRLFERAGASAIQIEDQAFPKRCGHLAGKIIIPAAEAAGKIKAACDARRNAGTLIIGRTDAVAVEGMAAALDRAELYAEAGADILFVEAPASHAALADIARRLGSLRPLLANMVEGGRTPMLDAAELGTLGFRIVIFPGAVVRAIARQAQEFYADLARNGSTAGFLPRMLDFDALNALIGTPEMLAQGKAYERFEAAPSPAVKRG